MGDGLAPSRQVDVAAIGTMIGELEILVVLTRGLTLVIVATYTRLAQVVDARPYEIAYDIGMVYYPFPIAESVTGKDSVCIITLSGTRS